MISSFTKVRSQNLFRLTTQALLPRKTSFSKSPLFSSSHTSTPSFDSSLFSSVSSSSISTSSGRSSSIYNIESGGIDLSNLSVPGSTVDPYWLEVLSKIQKPSARALIPQLVGDNPLGFDSNKSNVTTWSGSSATTLNTRKVQTKAQGKTLLGFAIEQKKLHPTKILLIRTGDFYETYGVDAVVLVAYAGLNPMGNKCKAGCPVKNIQATLDSLTQAGFTVAVYEEVSEIDLTSNVYASGKSTLAASTSASGSLPSSSDSAKSKLKTRALTQIISPGSRTYCYNLCMSPEDISFGEAQPIVGIFQTPANGYSLVQIYLDEQVVKVSERLSAESVQSFILQEGCVDPIFVHASGTGGPSGNSKESILKSLGLYSYLHGHHSVVKLSGIRELDFSAYLLDRVQNFYKVDTSAFRYFNDVYDESNREGAQDGRPSTSGSTTGSPSLLRPRPLYSSAALQIGLIPNENVPFLLPHLLPENSVSGHNSVASRFLKKWLLHPPPYHIADEMQNLCFRLSEFSHSIPNFTPISVGKLVSLLSSRQCNVPLFQSIHHNLQSFEQMVTPLLEEQHILKAQGATGDSYASLMRSLLLLTTFQSGLQLNFFDHAQLLLGDLRRSLYLIENTIATENSDQYHLDTVSEDPSDRIPADFFYRNEADFRQKLNINHPQVAKQHAFLARAAEELCAAVAHDFPAGYEVSQDLLDNSIFLREKPISSLQDLKKKVIEGGPEAYLAPEGVEYLHYVDRKGKTSTKKFTTQRVRRAVENYEQACVRMSNTMQQVLRELSDQLHAHVSVVLFVAHYAVILQSIYTHALSSKQKGWVLPKLAPYQGQTTRGESPATVYGVKPYWMTSPSFSSSSYSSTSSFSQSPDEQTGESEMFFKTPLGGISNDVPLNQMLLLTAPNMSGKSTLMRSVLVASLLANAGLFVPCSLESNGRPTVFPRFDGYFMRMSSYDIPVEGKSSFALEMDDMRVILKHATQNSLVMIDELGRGTSTREGTTLSSAFLEHINQRNITGIFATHLHELFALPLRLSNTKNVTMGFHANDIGDFEWTYKLEEGMCTESLAFHTARQFNIDESILTRASDLLKAYDQTFSRGGPALSHNGSSNFQTDSSSSLDYLSETEDDLEEVVPPPSASSAPRKNQEKIRLTDLHTLLSELSSVTSIPLDSSVLVPNNYNPPPFLQGKSVVYVLYIKDNDSQPGIYYVGETENLFQRLNAHRKFYKKLSPGVDIVCLAVPLSQTASGKSDSRYLETELIKLMKKNSFLFDRDFDASHVNFGR